jgi:hypothetical protein
VTAPPTPFPPDDPPKTRAKKDSPGAGPSGPSVTDTPKEPPRGRRKAQTDDPPREAPASSPKARKAPLQAKLEELFASPALVYSFVGDEWAAQLIATRTPAMAEAWYELAKQNAGVRRILDRLVEGSAWGGVILSTMAVAVPLAQHHGLIPGADPFGVMFPPLPPEQGRGPIVPPPPSSPNGGGGAPPQESPPGVVTVAGSNDSHTIVP